MDARLGWRWSAALFLVSLALRLTVVVAFAAWRDGVATAHHEHESIARSLARGEGFRFNFFGDHERPDLTSQQAPLVPFVLAGCYRLFGIETGPAFAAMLALQSLVSALTVVGIASLAAALLADGRQGRWAGVLAAGYPPLVISPMHIQALVWNLFFLTCVLLATQWLNEGRRWWGGVVFVAAAVGALLTDPILGGVVAGLLGLVVVGRRSEDGAVATGPSVRQRLALAGVIAVGVVLGVTPWIVRNYRVHGRFVPIKDSFFYVLWQGNNAVSQGTDKLLVEAEAAAAIGKERQPWRAYQAVAAVRRQAQSVNVCLSDSFIRELQGLPNEIERMDRFRALALETIGRDPGRYLRLCLQRLRFWMGFDATNPRSYVWHYRLAYLALASLTIVGLIRLWGRWRALAPVWVAAAALTAVHVLVITSARFRVPLELLYVVPASVGAAALGQPVADGWRRVAERSREWGRRDPKASSTPRGRSAMPLVNGRGDAA